MCGMCLVDLKADDTYVWTGAYSSDWSRAGNWQVGTDSAAVAPKGNSLVYIANTGGTRAYPVIDNSLAKCKYLEIQSGATLNGGSGTLTIVAAYNGYAFKNYGSFNSGTGKVVFGIAINGVKDVMNYVSDYSVQFYDLEINCSSSTAGIKLRSSGDDFVVSNELRVTKGQLSLNTKFASCGGDLFVDSDGTLDVYLDGFAVNGDLIIDGDLNLNSGYSSTIDVDGSFTGAGSFGAENMLLKIGESMEFSGSFDEGGSTVELDGTVSGSLGMNTFYKLKVNKTSGIISMLGDVVVSNEFVFLDGSLNCGTKNLTVEANNVIVGGSLSFASASAGVFDIQDGSLIGVTGSSISAGSATFKITKNFNYTGTWDPASSTVFFYGSNDGFGFTTSSFYNLTIEKGTTNYISANSSITVTNDFLLSKGEIRFASNGLLITNGDANLNGGYLNFGTNDLTISQGDLNINNGHLSFNTGGTSNLQLTNGSIIGSIGSFEAGNSTIKVAKNWYYQGDFTEQTSTVEFNGTFNSEIIENTTFRNLKIAKDAKSKQIASTTSTTEGVGVGEGVVSFTNILTYGTGYFLGGLRTTTTAPSVNVVGYANVKRPGNSPLTVTKYTGTLPPGGTAAAVKNYLVVSVESGSTLDVVYSYYDDRELNGNTAGSMATWSSIDGGTVWTKVSEAGTDNGGRFGRNNYPVSSGINTYFTATDNSNTSLPVEFDEELFIGKYKNDVVELNWLTHSETGLRGFIVYRSENLNSNFEQIDSWEDNLTLVSKHDENGGFTTNDTEYVYNDNSVEKGKVYYYRISAYCSDTDNEYHPKTVKVETGALDSNEPEGMFLEQNYPNPFNASTNINYAVSKETNVSLVLYNSNGQIAKVLVDNVKAAGQYSVSVSNSDISTGVYYYVMKAGDFKSFKKMIVVK